MGDKDGLTRKEFLASLGKGMLGAAVCAATAARAGAAPTPAPDPLPFTLLPAGTLNPGLDKPLGVAFDSRDNLYAAGAAGVRIFNPGGQAQRALKTAAPAVCVTVDAEGFVYAAGRTRVEKFDPAGSLVKAWSEEGRKPGQLSFVTGIAANESSVYLTDSGSRRIHRFAADGDYVDQITGPSEDEDQKFIIPSAYFDCKLGPRGILYVGHTGMHRVERYDATLKLVGFWGKFGNGREDFCGCCNPTNLALLADGPAGKGCVATTEKGVPRLKVYDAAGKLLACLDEKEFPGNTAGMALAADAKGRIALLEPVSKMIRFYEMKKA